MSNLVKRTLSALILAPLVIGITYIGGMYFFVLVAILFFAMLYEWIMLTAKFKQAFLWWVFGFFYIGGACFVMLFLERLRIDFMGFENIPLHLYTLTFLVWVNDIFSYIFGKSVGGPKLIPSISPGKTWSGTLGGITACVGVFFIMNYIHGFNVKTQTDQIFYAALALHIIVPIIALTGDLFESWVKRKAGVKDSGSLIPGHGGVLDRMDGIIMVMNVVGIILLALIIYQTGILSAGGVK